MATIRLKTNVPLRGTVQYCNYAHSDKAKAEGWQPQLGLKGTWDGEAGTVYLPMVMDAHLLNMGLIQEDGKDKFDNPAYRVLSDKPIVILKAERDDGRKETHVRFEDDKAPEPQQSTPKSQPKPQAKSSRDDWREMRDRMVACLRLADQAWRTAFVDAQGSPDILSTVDASVLHATAATFYIEAQRRGLTAPPIKDKETQAFFNKYPWLVDGQWEHPRTLKQKGAKERLSTQVEAMLAEKALPDDVRQECDEIYSDMCHDDINDVSLEALKDLHQELVNAIQKLDQ